MGIKIILVVRIRKWQLKSLRNIIRKEVLENLTSQDIGGNRKPSNRPNEFMLNK